MRCQNCGSDIALGAKFCGECGERQQGPLDASKAERRQLTVCFFDLVGSTSLSQNLDAEQLYELYAEYRAVGAEVIAHYEGSVAQYLGDGILVYFGYPIAHEDDALRAVKASLDVLARVDDLTVHGESPGVRAAIHTGLVVVGEVGAGEHRERLATGQVPNIAAHMQSVAQPGTVVVSKATKRLVEGYFSFEDLGLHSLKGVDEPARLFQVLGQSEATSRFAAQTAIGLAPFVGREDVVSAMKEAWALSADGGGQTLLLRGEAGLGKSRLLGVALEIMGGQAHDLFQAECSPYHMNTPFYPIAEMLSRRAGLQEAPSASEKLDRLERLHTGGDVPTEEAVPLLAEMLDIPTDGRYPQLELAPPKRRQRLLDVLVDHLLHAPEGVPQVFFVEDLHWADPSTLDLVRAVVERQATTPTFMVCTTRPAGPSLPTTLAHCREMEVLPLPEEDAGALVAAVAGTIPLPKELADEVVRRTGGVPLFIEAVIESVMQTGLLQKTENGYDLVGPLPAGLIPATVHDSLTARIDRLGTDKPLAQLAATIGREFDFELLQAVAGQGSAELSEALERIVELGIMVPIGAPTGSRYGFKHALVQDAAYESLLKRTRQNHHRNIAEIVVASFPHKAESEPELPARHYELCDMVDEASDFWMKAAEQAQRRWAQEECVVHLRKVISLQETRSSDDPGRIAREMAAQLALGPVLMATRGWGSPEVERACTRARELCEQTGNGQGLLTALWGLWTVHFVRGDMVPALEAADPVLQMALATENPVLRIAGRHAVGFTHYFMGDFDTAREHGEEALALFDLEQERALVAVFQLSSSVACGVFLSQSLWFMGYPEQAEARHSETWDLVEALAHPPSTAYGLGVCIFLHYAKRDRETIARWAERLHTLATEEGFLLWSAQARIYRGWAQSLNGDPLAGLEEMEAGVEEYRLTGSGLMIPQLMMMLAEGLHAADKADDALAALSTAMETAEARNERAYEPELYRLRGEIQLQRGDVAEGEASLRRAMEIAQGQSAKMLELRAALALVRYQRDQGRSDDATTLLQPIYDWFQEGLDTPELQEARELLTG